MKKKSHKIIYSDKKHTEKGIFSTALAVISFVTILLMVFVSYIKGGEASNSSGAVVFLCTLFSAAGVIIGYLGKNEPEKFYFFAYMGIIWNVVDLFMVSGILYAGI